MICRRTVPAPCRSFVEHSIRITFREALEVFIVSETETQTTAPTMQSAPSNGVEAKLGKPW
jgi:hypothetical protein